MHLIFVGAHPDDEAFASGTIAKYVDRGHDATIIMVTRGGRGHWEIPTEELEEIRTGEMEVAARILGADLLFLDHLDADVPGGDILREELVEVYRRLKPDIVITFHPLVWRDDHRRVGLAASDAGLKASLPLVETGMPHHRPEPEVYFFGRLMAPVEPDVYVDVSEYIDVKIEAFRQHSSQWVQWEIDEGDLTIEDFVERYRHRFRQFGVESGVGYAEAFISKAGRNRALDLLPTRS